MIKVKTTNGQIASCASWYDILRKTKHDFCSIPDQKKVNNLNLIMGKYQTNPKWDRFYGKKKTDLNLAKMSMSWKAKRNWGALPDQRALKNRQTECSV